MIALTGTRAERLWDMPLSPWLDVGDPLADAVVSELRRRRVTLSDALPAIRAAAPDDQRFRDFLADVEQPPHWADFDRMQQGGAMAYRNAGQLIVALTHGGLLTTFCSADAAYILARTNRLERNVVRRLFESSTLFLGVYDADSLRPGGSAWETCVHVRLMHAMVRRQLLRSGDWPLRGQPVNALMTAAGPLFFGAMVLDRLRALGAHMTPEEADGFYLIWRYVTRVLGVPPDLLGETAAEQAVLDARILPLAFDPDENSRRLTAALMAGLTKMPNLERVPMAVHEVLARHVLGDERADAMGIRPHRLGSQAMNVAAVALKAYALPQRIPVVAQLMEASGRSFLRRTVREGLNGAPADIAP